MSPAAFGIDYTAGPGHAPGAGRYVRELVRALVRIGDDQSARPPRPLRPLRLVEFGRAPVPMEGGPLGLTGDEVSRPFRRVRLRLPRRVLVAADRLSGATGAAASRGCALFHRMPSERQFKLRAPMSLAVAEFPAPGCPADEQLARECTGARGVIVFSQDAAARVASRYGVDRARIHQVPVGCEHWERELKAPPPRRTPKDVLVLGAIRRSRLPLDVLAAFEALAPMVRDVRLLIVGRPGDASGPFTAALERSPIRSQVRWIQDPVEARMPECVAGASALLHLTEDEASPVTPLEAARMGLAVVASRIPAFEEALGSGASFVDSGDAEGTAHALAGALEGAQDGAHSGASGIVSPASASRQALRDISAPFTWRASAEAHLAAWQTMLSSAPPPSAG